jgi:hypothetical protein
MTEAHSSKGIFRAEGFALEIARAKLSLLSVAGIQVLQNIHSRNQLRKRSQDLSSARLELFLVWKK